MIRLRKILLSNYLYYIILFIVIIISIIRINIGYSSNYSTKSKKLKGIITSIKIDNNYVSLKIKDRTGENIICSKYINKENNINTYKKLNVGDSVKIDGEFNKIEGSTTTNTFNYKKYAYLNNMFYKVKINNIKLIQKNINIIYMLKNNIYNYFDYYKNGKYLKLILLGDKTSIDTKIIDSFRNNGISHLFAISGMHVGFITSIILMILEKIKVGENKRYFITSILLFIYLLLIGNSPSIIRAFLFFILLSVNKIYYFYIDSINIFILTLSITLLINPFFIYDIGFLYSFIISLTLILSSDKLNKYNNYFTKLFITSVYSFIVSIPITLFNFYSINLLGILYNLFFVPFVTFILFPSSIIVLIFPCLSFVYDLLIKVLENFSLFLNNINFLKLIFGKLNIMYYFMYLILFFIYIKKGNKKIIAVIIVLLIFHYNYFNIFDNKYITMLDVGQGDSIILHNNRKTIMIDTGGIVNYHNKYDYKNSIIRNITIPYLKSNGIRKIDYLILSHGDFDHMGEAINLLNNFKVDIVIFNCGRYNYLEKKLIKILNTKNIKYYSCISNIEDNLYFLQTKDFNDENDNSNVVYTEIDGYKFMFMGDASSITEKEIINTYELEEIDILKVGHHGSRTSSSKEFINEINPKYALISVGKDNKFKHPNKEALENLKNSKIYRTDQDGSVMFKIKNNKLKIETCVP